MKRGRPYCSTVRELIARGHAPAEAMQMAHRIRAKENRPPAYPYRIENLSPGCAARRRRYKREWMRQRRAEIYRARQLELPWIDRDRGEGRK